MMFSLFRKSYYQSLTNSQLESAQDLDHLETVNAYVYQPRNKLSIEPIQKTIQSNLAQKLRI